MARSHPHSRKSGEEASAEDLRAQVALLAEQVRRLGQESGGRADEDRAVEAPSASPADLPPPPAPRPRRPFPAAPTSVPDRAQEPSSPAAQGEAPVAPPEQEVAPGAEGGVEPLAGAGATFADRSSQLVASVVALAELAAIEIRTGAEVEAAAIRAQSSERSSAANTAHLVVLLERQRRMLAALVAQTERMQRAGAVIRAQIVALEAECEYLQEVLETGRNSL